MNYDDWGLIDPHVSDTLLIDIIIETKMASPLRRSPRLLQLVAARKPGSKEEVKGFYFLFLVSASLSNWQEQFRTAGSDLKAAPAPAPDRRRSVTLACVYELVGCYSAAPALLPPRGCQLSRAAAIFIRLCLNTCA